MDPATVGFDVVSSLISALSLFLSRLDARRHRSAEPPDLKTSLLQLSKAFDAWEWSMRITNQTVQKWMAGDMSSDVAAYQLLAATEGQSSRIDYLIYVLRYDRDDLRWRSVEHLLEIYGRELLVIIENAIGNRVEVIEQLIEYLPTLGEEEPEAQESALATLDSTWREVGHASTMLKEYIRTNFPLNHT